MLIFLLHTEALEKVNHTNITKLLDKTHHFLWLWGIKYDNILLFLSDNEWWQKHIIMYSKFEHVTCLAHRLYRVVEEIYKYFTKIDQLISNVKKDV